MISVAFVVTCVLVVIAPGPSFAVIVHTCLRHGRTMGLATVAGNTSALVFWAFASAFGLTALIRTSEITFTVLKVAGAVYLCWLGAQTLLRGRSRARPFALPDEAQPSSSAPGGTAGADVGGERRSWRGAYRAGLLTNLTNPKAAVLYLALFPQFLPHGSGLADVLLLAGVQMSISAGWYVLVVVAVAAVGRVLSRPRVRLWLDRLTSCVLIGLGLRMVALTRPLA